MQRAAWIAAFACLPVGFGWVSWSASLNQKQQSIYHASTKKSDNKTSKVATDERIADYTWWLAILTGGLVLVSGVQGFFLLRADKTARIAANAVSDQARLTREAMVNTQRAFVFVRMTVVSPQTIIAQSSHGPLYEKVVGWQIFTQWENSGDTPTRRMFAHASIGVFDNELPEDFAFPDQGDLTLVPALIGPKGLLGSPSFAIDVDTARLVKEGKKHLYAWGWAEYDDVFPNTRRHRTEFCNKILFVDPFPEKTSLTHRTHRKHNGADDECTNPLKT